MSKKINISLNDLSSIDKAINELQAYKKELKSKTRLFCEKLAEKGISVAFEVSQGDSHHFDGMVKFEMEWKGETLYLIGRNDDTSGLRTEWYDSEGKFHNDIISPILMLEFGSAGLAIKGHGGSFAPTGNHKNDTQWFYYEDAELTIKHYATAEEPHQPMNNAYATMVNQIKQTAKEVWK